MYIHVEPTGYIPPLKSRTYCLQPPSAVRRQMKEGSNKVNLAFCRPCRICKGIYDGTPVTLRALEHGRPLAELELGRDNGCKLCSMLLSGLSGYSQTLPMRGAQLLQDCHTLLATKHKSVFTLNLDLKGLLGSEEYSIPLQLYSQSTCSTERPDHIIRQEVATTLDLYAAVEKIEQWTASCDRYHPRCALPNHPILPRRVLDISSRKNDKIKLLELNGASGRYVALSYSWGPLGVALKTTTETLSTHLRGISWNAFPKTFQDVIQICRMLEIRYLWIDALCILQDDTEDWESESSKMAEIYSNSFLTIAATSCADINTSLFSERRTAWTLPQGETVKATSGSTEAFYFRHGFRLGPRLHLAHDRFIELENAHKHREDAPLLTRAWAFQERLLPSRTLHFHAEELVWECRTSIRCECGELDDPWLKEAEYHGADTLQVPAETNSEGWLKSLFASVLTPGVPHEKLSYIWMDLVSEFSRLDLTYESDRLPALSGLAAKFSNGSLGLGDYFAGMWLGSLARCLLYESVWGGDTFSVPPNYHPQAPSWSWASIPLAGSNAISYTRVLNLYFETSPDFKLLGLAGKVLGKNPFGWVKNGVLSVQGQCVRCLTVKKTDGTWALKRRASHMSLAEHDELAELILDGPRPVKNNLRITCLYLGSGLGIALHAKSWDPPQYQRVGLVFISSESRLWEHTVIKMLDLV